jgi:hypothetical protein
VAGFYIALENIAAWRCNELKCGNILKLTQFRKVFLEANSRSTSQETPHLLWNQKGHYHFHNSTPLNPIQSQTNSVHTGSYLFKINFNTIFPTGLVFLVVFSLHAFWSNYCINFPVSHACCMPRPPHSPNNNWWSYNYGTPNYVLFISLLLGPNILLLTLFSNIFNLCSSLTNARYLVFHLYKTVDKTVILCI